MSKTKNMFYDGFPDYMTDGADFVGKDGIPSLLNLNNIEIPQKLISFNKRNQQKSKRGYIHFYIRDGLFKRIFVHPELFLTSFSQYDGIITPDPTIIIGKSRCLHAASTYANRAVGFYFQKHGIPVIPNLRWGDENTYDFAFSGVPKYSIVSISTLGAIHHDKKTDDALRNYFIKGLKVMLDTLQPKTILVYGYMPEIIFGEFTSKFKFVRYPSEIEESHKNAKGEIERGIIF